MSSESSAELITRYLNDEASQQEMDYLNKIIEEDPIVRAQFYEMAGQAYSAAVMLPKKQVVKAQEKPIPFPFKKTLAIAACLMLVLSLVFMLSRNKDIKPSSTARLLSSEGLVTSSSQETFSAGDSVVTKGPYSSASLRFDDGTILKLAGDTAVTLKGQFQKVIHVNHGSVSLDVTEQPDEYPLLVITPKAELVVKGTSFSVDTAKIGTKLEVAEGAVKFRRISDSSQVLVDAGKYSVAGDNSDPLEAKEFLFVPDAWEIDLRQHYPAQIDHGEYEFDSKGSRVGLRSTPGEGFDGLSLVSWYEDIFGYFKLQSDKTLKIKFKMDDPEWFNLFILYRPPELGSNVRKLCLYQNQEWWDDLDSGEWRTIEVPLATPRDINDVKADLEELPLNWYATQIVLSSGVEKRGMVVEKIWID